MMSHTSRIPSEALEEGSDARGDICASGAGLLLFISGLDEQVERRLAQGKPHQYQPSLSDSGFAPRGMQRDLERT
jgi:hypothetical protein